MVNKCESYWASYFYTIERELCFKGSVKMNKGLYLYIIFASLPDIINIPSGLLYGKQTDPRVKGPESYEEMAM